MSVTETHYISKFLKWFYLFFLSFPAKVFDSTITFSNDKWTSGPRMPEPKTHGSAVLLKGNKVFIAGGFKSIWIVTGTTFLYDIVTGMWEPRADMATMVAGAGVGAVALSNGTEVVIIAGGKLPSSASSDAVQAYNPDTDTWESLQTYNPLTNNPYWVINIVNGKTLVWGGNDDKVYEYQADNDDWSVKPQAKAYSYATTGIGIVYNN